MSRPGVDVPDHRGRTGLHLTGRDLDRNPDVVVRDVELLCAGWHVLRRTTFDHRRADGTWSTQQRETYDRGDGAAVLPYDVERVTVLLTRQFRWPVYVNGHPDGLLVEAAAGLLDDDDPVAAIKREAAEGKDIEVLELPFTEALTQVRDGRIDDAKTVLLLQWAALWGLFAAGSAALPEAGQSSAGEDVVPRGAAGAGSGVCGRGMNRARIRRRAGLSNHWKTTTLRATISSSQVRPGTARPTTRAAKKGP